MAEDRRDVGLLAVTSADRLNAGWTRRAAGPRARARRMPAAMSSGCLADVPPHCGLVTVIDGHPATLAWLGSVMGHRTRALGVEHFGQTGTHRRTSTAITASTRRAIVAAAAGHRAGAADPPSQGPAVSGLTGIGGAGR